MSRKFQRIIKMKNYNGIFSLKQNVPSKSKIAYKIAKQILKWIVKLIKKTFIFLSHTRGKDHIHVEGECVVGEAGLPGHVTELVLWIVTTSPPLGVIFVSVNCPKSSNEAYES